jgi:hypothetical protein
MPALNLTPSRAPATCVAYAASHLLAQRVKARNKFCFRNAYRALAYASSCYYVEGLVAIEGEILTVLEHAWLQRRDGIILDVTPWYHAERRPATYFPIFRWTNRALHDLLKDVGAKGARFPLRNMLPERGEHDRRWRRGTLAAWRHMAAVHEERHGTAKSFPGSEQDLLAAVIGPRRAARGAGRRRIGS